MARPMGTLQGENGIRAMGAWHERPQARVHQIRRACSSGRWDCVGGGFESLKSPLGLESPAGVAERHGRE